MGLTPNNNKLYPEVLRSVAAPFTGSYQAIGTPLTKPAVVLKFYNGSTVQVTISWDGTNDHEVLPAGAFVLIDVSSNKELSQVRNVETGMQFYVKGTAGAGSFYLSSYFSR